MVSGLLPESQGKNLALTVFYVPCLLDIGRGVGRGFAEVSLRLIDFWITGSRLRVIQTKPQCRQRPRWRRCSLRAVVPRRARI